MIPNTPEAWTKRANTTATSHEAALWSEKGQRDRFVAVLKTLDPQPGEWLLDVGCGTGLLSTFMPEGTQYIGCDWSIGMIARARREHPGWPFLVVCPAGRYDLVACIGTFNLKHDWSKGQTWQMLRRLWDTNTPRAMAVTLYRGDDPNCLVYEPDEAMAFADSLPHASTMRIDEHRHNDFLLTVRR